MKIIDPETNKTLLVFDNDTYNVISVANQTTEEAEPQSLLTIDRKDGLSKKPLDYRLNIDIEELNNQLQTEGIMIRGQS